MNSGLAFGLAFGIGVVAGLRSMTAPALTCWAVHLGWLRPGPGLAWMGSRPAVVVFTLGAIAELVADKLPVVGKRTAPGPLVGRIVLGGLSGAAIGATAGDATTFGALAGGIGAVAGTFAGYQVRASLVKSLGVRDIVIALLEDALAILAGLFFVSRIHPI
jgi:uncharacterized membrane protein